MLYGARRGIDEGAGMRISAWTLGPEMRAEELEFLRGLIAKERPRGICLEVGTAAGGTLCEMLGWLGRRRRGRFVVVDSMGYFPNQAAVFWDNLRRHGFGRSTVDLRVKTSAAALTESEGRGERFGLILVDGDHSRRAASIDMAWAKLLAEGGLLLVHDDAPGFPGVRFAVDVYVRSDPSFQLLGTRGSLSAFKRTRVATGGEARRAAAWLASIPKYLFNVARKSENRWFQRAVSRSRAFERAHLRGYVDHEWARMKAGVRHDTLGIQRPEAGRAEFQALRKAGLLPGHRVVDYGCGTFRLGRYLMAYLDAGNYWGLDVTDRFFELGLRNLGSGARKKLKDCHFRAISQASLREAASARPDVVLVAGVLQCVPPRELHTIFGRLESLCWPTTQVLVTLLEADESICLGKFAYRHALAEVDKASRKAVLRMTVLRRGREAELLRTGTKPSDIRGRFGPTRGTLLQFRTRNGAKAGAIDIEKLVQKR